MIAVQRARARVRGLLIDGPMRKIAKPAHGTLVGVELALERLRDGFTAPDDQNALNPQVTALIKTFERPKIAKRLIDSIRRFYPSLRIIVVDDSRTPTRFEGVKTIVLPYDSGVSAGRAAGLEQITTPYLLLLDDDFVFSRRTRIGPVLAWMEAHPEADIVGGEVFYLPFYRTLPHQGLHWTSASPIRPEGSLLGGLPVRDKVPNFFLAKTASIRKVNWDPELKRKDHADFFTRAKGVLTSVFDARFAVLHAQTPFNKAYQERARDVAQDVRILQEKHRMRAALHQAQSHHLASQNQIRGPG